jgi:hypothetical protein
VSYDVPVALQVWMRAWPEVGGVHAKTRSGALIELAQVAASVPVPPVTPVKVPPPGGTTIGFWQAPTRGVGVGVGPLAFGGMTLKPKCPALVAYPSTTMKYVWPALTFMTRRDPWWSFGSRVKQALASSLHATSDPLAQLPVRTYTTES